MPAIAGPRGGQVPVALMGLIAAVLAAVGVVQLHRKRWVAGAALLTGAIGPLGVIPFLTVLAVRGYLDGERRTAGALAVSLSQTGTFH